MGRKERGNQVERCAVRPAFGFAQARVLHKGELNGATVVGMGVVTLGN